MENRTETKKGDLYILTGIPGSGKSTAAARFGQVVSSDEIRQELHGTYDPGTRQMENKVFKTLHQRLHEGLLQGKDMVYDATNLTAKGRRDIIREFQNDYDQVISVYVPTSLEESLQRNAGRERKVPEGVIRDMHQRLKEPALEEGFDHLIVL